MKSFFTQIKLTFLCVFAICIHLRCNNTEEREKYIEKHSILGNYDFSENYFTLFIISTDKNANKPNYYLYTKDTTLLNELQKKWVVGSKSFGRCYPDYFIYLQKHDTICLKLGVSDVCKDIFIHGKQYLFDTDMLVNAQVNRFSKLYKNDFQFNNMEERMQILSNLNKKNIIVNNDFSNCKSIFFNYVYRFNFRNNIRNKHHYTEDTIVNILSWKIKKSYPKHKFYLECSYSEKKDSLYIYQMDLYCDKELYEKFNLFKLNTNFENRLLNVTFYSTKKLN